MKQHIKPTFIAPFSSSRNCRSLFHAADSASKQTPARRQLNRSRTLSSSSFDPRVRATVGTHWLDSSESTTAAEATFRHTISFSKCRSSIDFGDTQLTNSINNRKPFSKIQFVSIIGVRSREVNEPSGTKFVDTFTKSRPTIKTLSYDSIRPKFARIRSFSGAPFDQSTKPLDSAVTTELKPSDSAAIPVVSLFESSQPIDAGSSMRTPISLWPGMYHSPVTNALWEARSSIFERLTNFPSDAAPQSELITKTPSESRTSILYKFSSDYILREQYRNPWNEIRMGKLLEDLDALAGTISFKHCSDNDSTTRPLVLVTASVDKMVLKKPICVDIDMKIVGAVTWVGRSSLEIQLEVTQSCEDAPHPSDSVALVANFTFVARDKKSGKSAPVNKVAPETEREKLLWEEAEERNKMRKQKRGQPKKEIEDGKAERLNELLAEGRIFCDMPALADRDSILIKDTCLQNAFFCQPQQRNIHGRIFGGFLMRRAFELAFATAYSFAGSAPSFLEVDHVDFLRPVDVGNFLRLKSCVLYTELENPLQPLINIEVAAHVTQPEYRSSEVSNKFYFTFSVHPEAVKSGLKIRNVVPATEEEARCVIEHMDAQN